VSQSQRGKFWTCWKGANISNAALGNVGTPVRTVRTRINFTDAVVTVQRYVNALFYLHMLVLFDTASVYSRVW
jgi:hypothetical protein